MRKILMLDTETAGGLDNPIVYDFGCSTMDMAGNPAGRTFNHVVFETFYEMKELMQTAYYAEKLPQYRDDIWDGVREVEDFLGLRRRVLNYMKENEITIVCAHNASFDIRALNNTIRVITGGRIRYFFPYGTEVWDTLKMARQVLGKMPTYVRFCEENDFMTKHSVPRPRFTAEVIYRFIIKDTTFEEAHTGLADVEIEQQIYAYIMRQHKKCDKVRYRAAA